MNVERHTLLCALSRVRGRLTGEKVMAEYDKLKGDPQPCAHNVLTAISIGQWQCKECCLLFNLPRSTDQMGVAREA